GFTCTTPPIGNGGTVSCDLASFAAGATATFVLVVHIDASTPAGSFVSDIATVATTATDPTEENNTSGTATLVGSANMSVTATGPAAATAGSQISYTLTLANSGPDDAHYVVLTDDLPADTTFVSFVQDTAGPPTLALSTPAVGGTGTVTASVNPPLSDFTAGTSIQFTLTVAIDTVIRDPTTITNTASASSSYLDPNPANNQATVTTTATGGTATPVPTTTPDPTPTPTTTPDPTPTPTTTPDASPTVTTEPSPTVTAEPSPTVTPTATPTPSATPVVVCPRVPKLKRATFRRAKRKLRRAGCAGKLHHRGKLRRHGKPTHVSSQRPKPGRPFRLGGRLSVKLR
ncbi:MAG: hypothetical protein QOI80_2829, partial [Solirubrobacteraceae bacterium]|nr:hypothetical protein [Solirubrobacteraceae bacterium]